jgi:hypothetical protein
LRRNLISSSSFYICVMNTDLATHTLENLPKERIKEYAAYWDTITPSTNNDVVKRWIFAFMSVHTSWRRNVMGYQALADLTWIGNKEELVTKINISGVGLHNQRAKGIQHLILYNDIDSEILYRKSYPSLGWQQYRNLLVGLFKGCHIGMAKVSFAIELIYPSECQVVCMDAHMLRLYGHKDKSAFKPGDVDYLRLEDHWLDTCTRLGYPPTIARHVYWDTLQHQTSTRYWSHVFEDTHER